jgi:hypothetical protein
LFAVALQISLTPEMQSHLACSMFKNINKFEDSLGCVSQETQLTDSIYISADQAN